METQVKVDNECANKKTTKNGRTPQVIVATEHTSIDHPIKNLLVDCFQKHQIGTYQARFSNRYRA